MQGYFNKNFSLELLKGPCFVETGERGRSRGLSNLYVHIFSDIDTERASTKYALAERHAEFTGLGVFSQAVNISRDARIFHFANVFKL